MLKIQQYLKNNGLEKLGQEYCIKATKHDFLPLVILNYSQIYSPKNSEICKEARGLVLEIDTWNLVARSFNRFFNLGECLSDEFNFNEPFVAEIKYDGSLILIYNYKGHWIINTRATFGDKFIKGNNITWQEQVLKALGVTNIHDLNLNKDLTYVCELVSPETKVIREYNETSLYLIAIFNGHKELPINHTNGRNFKTKKICYFDSLEEIRQWVNLKEKTDPTFEGFVVRNKHAGKYDNEYKRIKIKTKTWLKMNYLKEHSGISNIVGIILGNEKDEMLAYLPELKEKIERIEKIINEWKYNIVSKWIETRDIKDKKEFAMCVKNNEFAPVLFHLRKLHDKNGILPMSLGPTWIKYKKLFENKLKKIDKLYKLTTNFKDKQ